MTQSATRKWLVERKLETADGRAHVGVHIGAPEDDSGKWRCAYSMSRGDAEETQYAYGLDGLQALLMAFEGARVLVERSGARLKWAGGEPGDAGIPRFVPQAFGLTFSRMLGSIIDTEVERLSLATQLNARRP